MLFARNLQHLLKIFSPAPGQITQPDDLEPKVVATVDVLSASRVLEMQQIFIDTAINVSAVAWSFAAVNPQTLLFVPWAAAWHNDGLSNHFIWVELRDGTPALNDCAVALPKTHAANIRVPLERPLTFHSSFELRARSADLVGAGNTLFLAFSVVELEPGETVKWP